MSDIGIDVTAVDTEAKFYPGQVMCQPDGGIMKKYKYVKYVTAGADGVAGNVAFYVLPATDTTGTQVSSVVAEGGGIGAGVLQSAIGNGEYGWVQIKGPATLTTALTAGADGNALTGVGAGAAGTLDVSALVTDAVVAYAIDASAKIVLCDFPE